MYTFEFGLTPNLKAKNSFRLVLYANVFLKVHFSQESGSVKNTSSSENCDLKKEFDLCNLK